MLRQSPSHAVSPPTITAGFWNALADTGCTEAWIGAPLKQPEVLKDRIFR